MALVSILVAGCATRPPSPPQGQTAMMLIAAQGWKIQVLKAGTFDLFTAYPSSPATSKKAPTTLTVYIEGDGFAWKSRHQPSDNPTPIHPTALELALKDPGEKVSYLARPCQYQDLSLVKNCQPVFWTEARFSEPVLKSMDLAIDQLLHIQGATDVELVGYSGGGAIAALLASRRKNVSGLLTVAGVLDHTEWTRRLRYRPLIESLNPADQKLTSVMQFHFVGGKDRTVPLAVANSYLSKQGLIADETIAVIADFDHRCCWADHWPDLKTTGQSKLNQQRAIINPDGN